MRKGFYYFILFVGSIIIVISAYGYFVLTQRPGLPPDIKDAVDENRLVRMDDQEFMAKGDLEFILSQKSIGKPTLFFVRVGDDIVRQEKELVSYYAQIPYPIIYLIIGAIAIFVGSTVFLLRPEERRARIFYWASLMFSSAMMISGGFYCLRQNWISYLPGIIFYIAYPLAPALLLHFSFTFSRTRSNRFLYLIYGPAAIMIALLESSFLYSSLTSSIETFRIYQSIAHAFRFYTVTFLLGAIFHLINNYRKAELDEIRAQIKWILFGLFIGAVPFIFLYQIPRALKRSPILSEELSVVFLIAIPIAFAFAIVKFKLMNIELIINRSFVYTLLTVFTVGTYLLSVQIFQKFTARFIPVHEGAISVLAALIAAAAFHPARKKIQQFVDRSFFRMSYDYRRTVFSFNESAHRIIRPDHLIDFFLGKVRNTLPVDNLGVFAYAEKAGRKTWSVRGGQAEKLGPGAVNSLNRGWILSIKQAVRTEKNMDFSMENMLHEKNLQMIIPLSFPSRVLSGYLSMGKKKSGERFTQDDLELILTLAESLAMNLERIRLQEEVIFEKAEKEKYDELNRLKTEFISSVSHEIRTPMSSIQGISEMLHGRKIEAEDKREELLRLMARECSRLSRFVRNILDFGKIEQHKTIYNFREADICAVVEEVMRLYRLRLESDGFAVREEYPDKPIYLMIDEDAIKQALTNVLDNAIKYSKEKREIDVLLVDKKKDIEIHIRDKGIGIPEEAQDRIFDGFFRTEEASQIEPKGVGIGLKIVKHIIEAHGGRVRVHSRGHEGSSFVLVLLKHEKHTDH